MHAMMICSSAGEEIFIENPNCLKLNYTCADYACWKFHSFPVASYLDASARKTKAPSTRIRLRFVNA